MIHHMWSVFQTGTCSETAASILVNGVDLFRLDLQGVVSLVPSVLGVLECVLPEGELRAPSHLPVTLLRRAATHVLLSILPLPLHFQASTGNMHYHDFFVVVEYSDAPAGICVLSLEVLTISYNNYYALFFKGLQVKEVGSNSSERVTLSLLRPQLVNLLSNALQVESDPVNTQMLLGTLIWILALVWIYIRMSIVFFLFFLWKSWIKLILLEKENIIMPPELMISIYIIKHTCELSRQREKLLPKQ